MSLIYDEHDEYGVKAIDIQCSNCRRNTGLHSKDKTVEYSILSCGFNMDNIFKQENEI